jgi:hypothetical protein
MVVSQLYPPGGAVRFGAPRIRRQGLPSASLGASVAFMKVVLSTCLFAFSVNVPFGVQAADSLVSAGTARVDITPTFPIWLSGYAARTTQATSVAQPLWARALALGDDDEVSLLITVDNTGVPASVTEAVLQRLSASQGIARENFAVCSTHTHSGPMLAGVLPNLFSRDLTADEQTRIDQYTAALIDHLELAALMALSNREPARLHWGQGTVGFAANRRTAGGPVDHALPLLCVKSPTGGLRALFLNYACHCTTLGPDFNQHHGDWAGEAAAQLEQNHPTAVVLVAIGCGGEANPQPRTGLNYVQQHAQSIAVEVARLLANPLKSLGHAPTGQWTALSLPHVTLPTLAEWEARATQPGIVGYHAQKNLARLSRGETLPTTLPYAVQTWKFGDDLAMVFLPGEVVVDYSVRLKTKYDSSRLWINAYANDVPCYIPSVRILNEGGYEAETSLWYYDRPARLAPATEDLIINAVETQLTAALLPPPDLTPPALLSAASLDGRLIAARFDRLLDTNTAQLPAHYTFQPAATITNVTLRADGQSVVLSLQSPVGSSFTLVADGVQGTAGTSTRSEIEGRVLGLTAQDIGTPKLVSATLALGQGDLSVRAGGQDVWSNADSFNFIHQPRVGDFDVRVQVESFQGSQVSAKAALMVREDLTPGSRHFTLTVYPSQGNWTAFWRLTNGGPSTVASGNWRVNWPGIQYPNIWLRLKRTGNQFTAYGGGNGLHWIQIADAFAPTPAYPSTVRVGLATTALGDPTNASQMAQAEYRNYGDIGMSTPPELQLVRSGSELFFSWPAPASDYFLQQAHHLDPSTEWTTLNIPPIFLNGRCQMTLPVGTNRCFFRLVRP